MAYREFLAGGMRPPFLSAEKFAGQSFEGSFKEIRKYTTQKGIVINAVLFLTKTGSEFLIASFTLRVQENAPTGDMALNKPVRIRSVMGVWETDFL